MKTTWTKFRDVPFEEVKGCCYVDDQEAREGWERWRGQPVQIELPPVPRSVIDSGHNDCTSPFWWTAVNFQSRDGRRVAMCEHLIEID